MIKTLEMISLKNTDHDLTDLLLYFEGHDTEYTLYRKLMSVLEPLLPENFSVRVQRTQISFYGKHLFGAASVPIRRKKNWPPDCLMVTFGLEHRVDSPRIAVAIEPYPNRWTHHLLLTEPSQIDTELLDWLQEAYWFSEQKR